MNQINRKKSGIMGLLRPLGIACLVAAAAFSAAAADVSLKVELKNGTTDVFVLADKPEITFSGESCVISCKAADATYDMADIVRAYFSDATSSVEGSLAEGVSFDLTDPSAVVVSGLAPGESVALYSLDGSAAVAASADSSGVVRISLDGLASQTVYIVSINSAKGFKFYKK